MIIHTDDELLTVEQVTQLLKVPASWIHERCRASARGPLPQAKQTAASLPGKIATARFSQGLRPDPSSRPQHARVMGKGATRIPVEAAVPIRSGPAMGQSPDKVVALYARVSTLDQDCEVQLEQLRRYADKRFACYREYTDSGVSGTQRHRPQLDALMRDARKRLFDVVLVWKFDRFARSLKHLMESLDEFSALGIDFVSLTEGIDTTTPAGQLLFHIVGAVAQFERDLIAERVRAGMAHARALGRHIGRPRAIVDVEAVVKLREAGRSLREIAVTLNIPVSRVRRALLRLQPKAS